MVHLNPSHGDDKHCKKKLPKEEKTELNLLVI